MPDALQQGGMGEAFMDPLRGAVDDEQLTMGIAFARVQHPNMYRPCSMPRWPTLDATSCAAKGR